MSLDDELLNRVTWKIPNALVLVGSAADGERNAMTTSWITQLAQEPVLIGVGVDNDAVTQRLIAAGGSFSVNLWDAENTKVFVKFSKPAVDDDGTLNGRRSGRRPPARRSSTRRSRGWTARCGTRSTSAATPCSSARSSTRRSSNDEARPASMSDTRMKYGGVRRH